MYREKRQMLGASRCRLILGLLCIALVVFAGTLSVAHAHELGDVSHADCGLCATAHVTVLAVAVLTLAPVAQVFLKVEPSLPKARAKTLFYHSLFTRPPPATRPLGY